MTAYQRISEALRSDRVPVKQKKESLEELFKQKVRRRTNGEYVVTGEYKSHDDYIEMMHTKCGGKFEIKPKSFIGGTRCRICNSSKGERKIRAYLQSKGIVFKTEYTFEDLRSTRGKRLRFDFAIFGIDKNLTKLIEYDGEYHYTDYKRKGTQSFQDLKECDKAKDQYCKNNNINLIRIPYWEYKNIDKILDKHFKLNREETMKWWLRENIKQRKELEGQCSMFGD